MSRILWAVLLPWYVNFHPPYSVYVTHLLKGTNLDRKYEHQEEDDHEHTNTTMVRFAPSLL